ncbi:MAG: sulfatase-like hydrolase/transferase [Armatimonadota bacterium]|nr:sulfatase-like hydrolase/transferase [Armatimonadota bacterium]
MSFAKESAQKPNFVIIYCDDLGYGDLGCFGSKEVKTPNIDALANSGIRFTNWYSNSPVCSPSRASLLTGRYPRRAGVPNILGGRRGIPGLPTTEVTLASALRRFGYRTAIFGKWHLGTAEEYQPNAHGFDEFFGFLAGCVDYYSHIYYWGQGRGENPVHDLWHNNKETWANGRYLTELITEKAVEFIKNQGDSPFFLYIPYNAPHYPMHAPKKYLDRFPDLPLPRRIMAAMIAAVDDGVGEIVEALKQVGQYENTVIFFSSDNGPSTETRNWLDGAVDPYFGGSAGIFRGHKGSLFEGGIRMPAIMSVPSLVPAGQVCDEVGAMMDIFPTFIEFAGGELPSDRHIDGMSIRKVITEGAKSPHDFIFWEYNGQLAVRHGKWKLVLNGKLDFSRTQPDAVYLSDLEADPGEKINMADKYPSVVNELTVAVNDWFAELKE